MRRPRRLRPLRSFVLGKDSLGVNLPLEPRIKGRVRGCDGLDSVGASGPLAIGPDAAAELLCCPYLPSSRPLVLGPARRCILSQLALFMSSRYAINRGPCVTYCNLLTFVLRAGYSGSTTKWSTGPKEGGVMPSKPYDSADHNVAGSRQNKAAGRILVRARQTADLSQTEFASAIAKRLGLPSLAQGSYSGWEIHARTVPAAALIAATEIARPHGFALADAIEAETGPANVSQSARLAAALEAMAETLEGDAAESIREAAESIRPKRRAANSR